VTNRENPWNPWRFPFPNKPFDVVGFGLNAVDHLCVLPHYPERDTKTEILDYKLLPGGQVATAIAFLGRAGLTAKYIGKVGSDPLGRISLEDLRSEPMDTSSVLVEPGARNQYAIIIIEKTTGERTILWERDPRLNFREGELKREDVCAGRVLLIDGHDEAAALQAADWAREDGIPVVIDLDKVLPRTTELLARVDFLIASAQFAREFTGQADPANALRELRRHCTGFVAATLGAEGALALSGDEAVHFPGFEVQAVDTTGAGDIFHAAFIYALLQNWPLEQTMRFANAAAALACTKVGARAAIPPLTEALRLAGIDQ
jgi:sugar/nucleoside kinase (ribokinase family)